jgi:hypothetical protein
MKRLILAVGLLVSVFAVAILAQTPPKPGPELQKLHVWVGHWTVDVDLKAGPLGPGGKIAAEYDGEMILGGFFFQGRWKEKGVLGEYRAFEIIGYDATNRNYPCYWFQDNGTVTSGAVTVNGNTQIFEGGKYILGGKPYMFRDTFLFSPDLMGVTEKAEISADDGKTWMPFWDGKYVKAAQAPKTK